MDSRHKVSAYPEQLSTFYPGMSCSGDFEHRQRGGWTWAFKGGVVVKGVKGALDDARREGDYSKTVVELRPRRGLCTASLATRERAGRP